MIQNPDVTVDAVPSAMSEKRWVGIQLAYDASAPGKTRKRGRKTATGRSSPAPPGPPDPSIAGTPPVLVVPSEPLPLSPRFPTTRRTARIAATIPPAAKASHCPPTRRESTTNSGARMAPILKKALINCNAAAPSAPNAPSMRMLKLTRIPKPRPIRPTPTRSAVQDPAVAAVKYPPARIAAPHRSSRGYPHRRATNPPPTMPMVAAAKCSPGRRPRRDGVAPRVVAKWGKNGP
jgi:hypothetical protein